MSQITVQRYKKFVASLVPFYIYINGEEVETPFEFEDTKDFIYENLKSDNYRLIFYIISLIISNN